MMNSLSNIPAQNFQTGPKASTSHSIESIMSGGGNVSNRMNYQTPPQQFLQQHQMPQQQQQQSQHMSQQQPQSSHMQSNYGHMMQRGGMSR